MANEIVYDGRQGESGLTLYATVQDAVGGLYAYLVGTPALEAKAAGHWANYAIALTEGNPANYQYVGTMPATGDLGGERMVTIRVYERLGATPALTDRLLGVDTLLWLSAGSALWPVGETVLGIRIKLPSCDFIAGCSEANGLAVDGNGLVTARSVAGDVGGKILGASDGEFVGVGVLAQNEAGDRLPSQAEVLAIQNNTRVRVVIPPVLERPDEGDPALAYVLDLYVYDDAGNMETPDSLPTLSAVNQAGASRAGNLSAVSNPEAGHYQATYTVADDHAMEQLRFQWTIIEGGVSRFHGGGCLVVDTTAVDFTQADRDMLSGLATPDDVENLGDVLLAVIDDLATAEGVTAAQTAIIDRGDVAWLTAEIVLPPVWSVNESTWETSN